MHSDQENYVEELGSRCEVIESRIATLNKRMRVFIFAIVGILGLAITMGANAINHRANSLRVSDGFGKDRIIKGVNDAMNPYIEFFDEEGQSRVFVGISREDKGIVYFRDKDGNESKRVEEQ